MGPVGTKAVSAKRTGGVTDVKKAGFFAQWIDTNVSYGSVSCWTVPCGFVVNPMLVSYAICLSWLQNVVTL